MTRRSLIFLRSSQEERWLHVQRPKFRLWMEKLCNNYAKTYEQKWPVVQQLHHTKIIKCGATDQKLWLTRVFFLLNLSVKRTNFISTISTYVNTESSTKYRNKLRHIEWMSKWHTIGTSATTKMTTYHCFTAINSNYCLTGPCNGNSVETGTSEICAVRPHQHHTPLPSSILLCLFPWHPELCLPTSWW